MKIQLNKEQSKLFLEMVVPELIKIQKIRQANEREEKENGKQAVS